MNRQKVFMGGARELNPAEVMPLFREICRSSGYMVAATGVRDVFRIEKIDEALRRATPEPPPGMAEPDTFILYVHRVQSHDLDGVMEAARQYVGDLGRVQRMAGGTLIIKAPSRLVQGLRTFLNTVDQAGPSHSYRIYRPRNLLPSRLSALSQDVITPGKEAGPSGAKLQADDGVGLLLISGPMDAVEAAAQFMSQLDRSQEAGVRQIRYYPIKNTDVLSTARKVSILSGVPMVDGSRAAAAPSQSGAEGSPGSSESSASSVQGSSPLILADTAINTLVVVGPEGLHEKVQELLRELDRRRAQVLIEAAIVQVTTDDSVEAGGEMLFEGTVGRVGLDGGIGHGVADQSDASGSGMPDTFGVQAVDGGMLRVLQTNVFQAIFRAISTKSNVHIMARPLLLVNDNEQATFSTSSEEPTTTTSIGTATTNVSFQGYATATTRLEITPHVSEDRYLVLEIVQQFEEFGDTSGVAGIPPAKISHDVSTKVTVPDRATIIIGGFVKESEEVVRRKVPVLGDIPLIGLLFRHHRRTKKYSRMYLFVRPHILDEEDFGDLVDISREKSEELSGGEKDTSSQPYQYQPHQYQPYQHHTDSPAIPPEPVDEERSDNPSGNPAEGPEWSTPLPQE